MARVPRATRIKKGGVEFVSKVDRANYTIKELTRAAQLDSGKFLISKIRREARQQIPGMKRSKRINNSFQYWVRKVEGDMQIGAKHDTHYGVHQELGTRNQPKRAIIKGTVMRNISEIRKIQGAYLSAIENENKALGLIKPDEEGLTDKDE